MGRKHSLQRSFGYAFEGVRTALKREPNFRIHITIATLVIFTAAFLRFNFLEWLMLILTIYFVLILELLNTVIEAIVNLESPNIHPEARVAKDVSAAAVLLSATVSVVVGVVLFLPKILSLLAQ